MKKVFISSVVAGFEDFRQSAKQAVELMGYRPLMCEDFGARPYSSEKACVTEVESCDVYVVILGAKYGFVTAEGISVTEAEFNAANRSGKPTLVFIQKIETEEAQSAFRSRVEDFSAGFFRESFSSPEQLKDGIIKGLRQLSQFENAIPEKEFIARVEKGISELSQFFLFREPEMFTAFWPHPKREIDIVELENQTDEIFERLCRVGLTSFREGYEPILKRDYTGLKSGDTRIAFFHDGLIVFLTSPVVKREGFFFSNYFAPPSRIKELAHGIFKLFDANSGWCRLEFREMENITVKELPKTNVNQISMGSMGENKFSFDRLFIPLTESGYLKWIDMSINRLKRIFS